MSTDASAFTVPQFSVPLPLPGRALAEPNAFPPIVHVEREVRNGGLKREREEDNTAVTLPASELPNVSTSHDASPLLNVATSTLLLPPAAAACVQGALHQERRDMATLTASRSSSQAPLAATFSSLAEAQAYFAHLYGTPEKQERATRRPVDYESCMKVLRANREKRNMDECVSSLTRGQHAHYAPGLTTVYTVHGTRAARWRNSALHPDAAMVAEVAEVEQAEMKTKLMFAVCTCPRCTWHPPPLRSSAAEASSLRDSGDSNMTTTRQKDHPGNQAADEELTFDVVADVSANTAPSTKADEKAIHAPRPSSVTTTTAFGDTHEHLNYNFLEHAHVTPFVRRRRLHRVQARSVAFLRCVAREQPWLLCSKRTSLGDAKRPEKLQESADTQESGSGVKLVQAPPARLLSLEDRVMRLTPDGFAERYQQHPAEEETLVTTASLRRASVHSPATRVVSRSVQMQGGVAASDVSRRISNVTGNEARATPKSGAHAAKPVVTAGEKTTAIPAPPPPPGLTYAQLDELLPGDAMGEGKDQTESADDGVNAFLTKWARAVDGNCALHSPSVIPLAPVTRATAVETFSGVMTALKDDPSSGPSGTTAALQSAQDIFQRRLEGVSFVFDKRALHMLLTAHVTKAQVPGKDGFRLPVRVRVGPTTGAGVTTTTTTTTATPKTAPVGVALHVEVGCPFPRSVETRREMQTAAAKALLKRAMTANLTSSITATGDAERVMRRKCCAELVLSKANASTDRNVEASSGDSAAESGVVEGNPKSPSTAALVAGLGPSRGISFHVVASATTIEGAAADGRGGEPVPVFDMVKLDYLYGKSSETTTTSNGCAARASEKQQGGADSSRATSCAPLGIHTTMFATDVAELSRRAVLSASTPDPSAAPAQPASPLLLEAFTTSEALEMSLLFHSFPTATVRVHHVNAYTGAIIHVDVLTATTWQPLLQRRLTAITATVNPVLLEQHRERVEEDLVAHARSTWLSSTQQAAGTTPQPEFHPSKTSANRANLALFLPVKDRVTSSALTSISDIRYAWDCLYDLLASLCHNVVVATATHLCEREKLRAHLHTQGEAPSWGATELEREVFSFILCRANTAVSAHGGNQRKHNRTHPAERQACKIEMSLQDVSKVYPGLNLRYTVQDEVSKGLFVEGASGAVCEREYGGLRDWPLSDRIPMTFPLSQELQHQVCLWSMSTGKT